MKINRECFYMNLRILLILAVILIQGCATSTTLKPSGKINSDIDRDQLIQNIEALANQCWARDFSMLGDAVNVRRSSHGLGSYGYGIKVSRWAPDLGHEATQPMFSLHVSESGSGSTVVMSEGECGFLCPDSSYSDDVRRWVDGDNSCAEK